MICYSVACQSNTLVMKIGLFKSCRSAVYLSPFLVDAVRDELLCGHGFDWLHVGCAVNNDGPSHCSDGAGDDQILDDGHKRSHWSLV